MLYTIKRLEESKSREGLNEIFVEIDVVDDDGFCFKIVKWLQNKEYELYKQDNNYLDILVNNEKQKFRDLAIQSLKKINGEAND